ncbi:hypothetical protein [Azorhizobium oxalatiphilum]|uniref:hypothetical protein n=1 Tax=Azorhizobium oxalatiphilum TaxID=980631 RepID=UPI001666780B|nr:hypothetical protein [Azorhizobium oxalatiphilum]
MVEEVVSQPYEAVEVGGMSPQIATSFTSFRKADGHWFFGAEVEAVCRLADRDFLRRDPAGGPSRRIAFRRQEFQIDLSEARAKGVEKGATLVIANLPLAQRRFQTATVQGYADKQDDFVFEELTGRPLPALPEERGRLDDIRAVHALHRMPTNLFASQRVLSANVSSFETGAFVGYDDENDDELLMEAPERLAQAGARRTRQHGARQRADGHYALGVVRDIEALRTDLYLELRSFIDDLGSENYRVRIPRTDQSIALPAELAARALDHFNLAVFQAMAGAGNDSKRRFDRRVSHYVKDLTDAHLLAAIHRLDGSIPKLIFTDFEFYYGDPDGAGDGDA